MLYRSDFVRVGGMTATTPAPEIYFYAEDETVIAGTTSKRALYPFGGSHRLEMGVLFTLEGGPTSLTFSMAHRAFAATVRYEDGTWSADCGTGPVALCKGELDDAVHNIVFSADFGSGLWLATVVDGKRARPTVTPPWPPEPPEWSVDLEAVRAAHYAGEDDGELARAYTLNPQQVLVTREAEKEMWRRQNEPRPAPAPLATAPDVPPIRFSVAVEGEGSALVLQRHYGCSQ